MSGRIEPGQVYSSVDHPDTAWLILGVTDTHFRAVYLCTHHPDGERSVGRKPFTAKLSVLANATIVRLA